MFIVVVVFVMSLLYGYVGARLVAPFTMTASGLLIFWLVITFLAVAPIGGLVLRARNIENQFIDMLLWVGFIGLGVFSLTFIAFLVRDLGWFTGFMSFKAYESIASTDSSSFQIDPGRRQFILMSMNMGIIGLTSLLGGIGLFQARRSASIMRQKISIPNLPPGLQGLRIAQISDLHVGPTIKADYAQAVVDQVNALNPDLIFFTGDMVDGTVDHLVDDVEPLRGLNARYGKFFVTGNHEYYSGVEQWISKVGELGMTNLHNEHRILSINGAQLAIAGVTDLMAHNISKAHTTDPQKAVAGIPREMPTILLAHQPGTAPLTDGLAIDLMVSGHTHGGQYIPFNLAVNRIHPYAAGWYKHGDMQVYVNRGTGYWGPPLRLGVPSEITLFELST